MFWYEVRVMFVLALAAFALYCLFRLCKWIFLTSERREQIDDVKIEIKDTYDCAKEIKDVDDVSLSKAKTKIDKFVSRKGKNGTSKKSK